MRAEALAELCAVMRGVQGGTAGTLGTLNCVPAQKCPSFHVFQAFQVEHAEIRNPQFELGTAAGTLPDAFDVAERAAIAIELGRVAPAYAEAWAAFQTRKPGHVSEAEWSQAIDAAGRFLDEWAGLALDFGWRPLDIFGPRGLAWFCAGERVRALGPDNAITVSGRIFARLSLAEEIAKQGIT
jgi:hypothetical protein